IEDHLVRRRALPYVPIDSARDAQVRGVDINRQFSPKRAEGVEALAACELPVFPLKYAVGYIVRTGIAEYGSSPIGSVDAVRPPAYHDCQLRFVIDALPAVGNPYRLAVTDER